MSQVAQSISYQSASRQINGYLARPEGDGPFPGIVVIHEAFGLNENIKDITRRMADAGYIALAVDLFTGRNQALCMFRFMGGFIFNSLNNGGIHDLKAALTYLTEQSGVDSQSLGAIGFCMGGSFAIAWACTDNRLKAIAPFYGMNPRPSKPSPACAPSSAPTPTKTSPHHTGRNLMLS